MASQGLPSGPAELTAIAAQLVDYENKVAVGEAMVKIFQHKKRLRELEFEYNLNMNAPELHPMRTDGSFSAPVRMNELLTSSEPIEDPATAAVAARGLLWGGAFAQEPLSGTTLAASDDVGSSSDSALPAAAHSGLSGVGPSCLADERALVLADQLPSLPPHRVRAAHEGSVTLKGITNSVVAQLRQCTGASVVSEADFGSRADFARFSPPHSLSPQRIAQRAHIIARCFRFARPPAPCGFGPRRQRMRTLVVLS